MCRWKQPWAGIEREEKASITPQCQRDRKSRPKKQIERDVGKEAVNRMRKGWRIGENRSRYLEIGRSNEKYNLKKITNGKEDKRL